MYSDKAFNDFKIINYYVGLITLTTAFLMIIPLITSLFFTEWNTLIDFLISFSIATIVGSLMVLQGKEAKKIIKIEWKHGLIIASSSWIILMILCAIPYWLSGNCISFLDACFDVMSGFTTTGLILTQDIDHISMGFNMWRHILTFVGGQGMVVLALSVLVKNTAGAYKMYVGEGKDIGLLPNVKNTTKIIWLISMIYFLVGTIAFWINGILIGLNPINALMHGMFIFASAWSTGGFAPMSQNVLYYHSLSYEILTIIFFIIGSFNFGLHYAVWKKNKMELIKNIEIQSFIITSTALSIFLFSSLYKNGVYSSGMELFRKGIYQLLSAHTTTGFGTLYARQLAIDWGGFAILMMTIAMLIGGSACSTAGGFKGLRVGIVFKALISDIRKALMPDNKVRVTKIHHIKDIVLDDNLIKSSMLIILCYIAFFTFLIGLGSYYGYSVLDSAFEAASVAGNVGLSIGITTPSMPNLLKASYILVMYLGRLEFISAFALFGYILGGVRKLCKKYFTL